MKKLYQWAASDPYVEWKLLSDLYENETDVRDACGNVEGLKVKRIDSVFIEVDE